MKAFLTQIDWVRNTFFFVFYFFLVAGFFIGLVKPSLNEFRINNAKYRKELYVLEQIQSQRKAEEEKLSKYEQEHNVMLSSFKHKLTQKEIQDKLNIIFNIANVVPDGAPFREGEYIKQRYIISGKVKDIVSLKDALGLSKALEGITQFSFPIHIEREGEMLVFSFRLDAYSLPE